MSSRKTGAPSVHLNVFHHSENPSAQPTAAFLEPSAGPSVRTTKPSSVPLQQKSIGPTRNAAELSPEESSSSPSAGSIVPDLLSLPPSYRSVELEATILMAVTSENHVSGKVDLVCSTTGIYLIQEIKASYGYDTETSFSCGNDESISDGTQRKLSSMPVVGAARTYFPIESTAPEQDEYATFVHGIMRFDLTKVTLPMKIRTAAFALGEPVHDIQLQMDTAVTPPVLMFYFDPPLLPAASFESSVSRSSAISGSWVGLLVTLVAVCANCM
jgi:hypothetical protein